MLRTPRIYAGHIKFSNPKVTALGVLAYREVNHLLELQELWPEDK
jgi:hypothetical protein